MECRPDIERMRRVTHDPWSLFFGDPHQRLQVALTLTGALLFASAILIVIGPLDPFSPQQASIGTEDDQRANSSGVEADTPTLSEGDEQTTTATQTPRETADGDADDGDAGAEDSGETDDQGEDETDTDERAADEKRDREFQKLSQERQELQKEHERLTREHQRLEGNETTDKQWEEHQKEYEQHREEFRDHREGFEEFVDEFGESERTVEHRQWLRKRGTQHTIHNFNKGD